MKPSTHFTEVPRRRQRAARQYFDLLLLRMWCLNRFRSHILRCGWRFSQLPTIERAGQNGCGRSLSVRQGRRGASPGCTLYTMPITRR